MDDENSTGATQHAPWLPVPSRAISVVEHPAVIKNVDKGIASLGGPVKLSKVSRKRFLLSVIVSLTRGRVCAQN